jgi:hypothetical protein
MENNELKEAKLWFDSRGIAAREYDGELMIEVGPYEVMVSHSEILYRAELYKEENPQ